MADIDQDTEFTTDTVVSATLAEGLWTVQLDVGTIIVEAALQPDRTIEAGHTVKCYGRGLGYSIRGVVIDDVVWRYETAEEAALSHEREQVKRHQAKRDEFEATGRAVLDAKYAALPALFQQRLDRFRANNPEFRWEYEPYEMFCCEEAVKLAAHLGTVGEAKRYAALASSETYSTDTPRWNAEWEEQKAIDRAAGLATHEHSGNTHGMTAILARLYLEQPDLVPKMHGALTPLVGCEAYGCDHPDAANEGAESTADA
jgi:hypothetical protein